MKKKLTDITPSKYRCDTASPMCPAIFLSDAGTYVIVGKTIEVNEHHPLRGRVGKDETAIEILSPLVDDAIASKKSR